MAAVTPVSDTPSLLKERNMASLHPWRAVLGRWPKAGQASVTLMIQKPKFLLCFFSLFAILSGNEQSKKPRSIARVTS